MFAAVVVALVAVAAPEAESAERLAAKGFASFQAQDYRLAADFFLRAYAISGEATALRNAARALEEAQDFEPAMKRWKEYRASPGINAEDRREAERHLLLLTAKLSASSAPDSNIRSPSSPPLEPRSDPPLTVTAPQPESKPIWPLIAAGIGGGVLVAGGITYAVGQSELDSLRVRLAIVDQNGKTNGVTLQEAERLKNKSDDLRTAGVVLGAAGIATAAASLIFWLSSGEGDSPNFSITAAKETITVGAHW